MAHVEVDWLTEKQFEGTNDENAKFRFDIKKRAGGLGNYASPTDHLLAAIASCSGVDIVTILEKKRQKFASIHVDIDGTQAETPPKYFTSIKLVYSFTGENLNQTQLEQAVDLAINKFCSVRSSLRPECQVTWEVKIV